MPDLSARPSRNEAARGFASGLVTAAAVALLASVSPVLALGAIAVGVVAVVIRIVTAPAARARYLAMLAGLLIGLGSLFLLISVSATMACGRTADFCGDANPTPLLAAGAVVVVLGFLAGAGAVVANRRSRSRETGV